MPCKSWIGVQNSDPIAKWAVNGSANQMRTKEFRRRVRLLEGIVKTTRQGGVGFVVGPHIQRPPPGRVESSNIIQAHDVIGMAVREYDGINRIDAMSDTLQPQFRRRIDQTRKPG